MRNLIFTALAVVLVLSSCSKEEVVESKSSNAIGFKTFVGNTTKAVDATIATIEAAGIGFNVYGWHNTGADLTALTDDFKPNYFDEVNVTLSESSWTYSPLKYWPATGKLNFIALANNVTPVDDIPATLGNYSLDFPDSGDPTLYYTCTTDPLAQKDLLMANNFNQTKGAAVPFEFKHILSKIDVKLKAECSDDNLQLKVTRVSFTGINDVASLNLVNFIDANVPLDANDVWTIDGSSTPALINVKLENDEYKKIGNAGNDFENPQATNGGLIIVPQAMNNIEVEYQFLQKDGNDEFTQVIVDCTGDNKKTVDLGENSWEIGKKYLYNLSIKFDPNDPNNPAYNSVIVFDGITVTDWDDNGAVTYTIPVNN